MFLDLVAAISSPPSLGDTIEFFDVNGSSLTRIPFHIPDRGLERYRYAGSSILSFNLCMLRSRVVATQMMSYLLSTRVFSQVRLLVVIINQKILISLLKHNEFFVSTSERKF